MRDFEYHEPASIAEASAMLAAHGDQCRLVAGGTALMLVLRQRMLAPTHLISLAKVRALRGITYDDRTGLRIGALSTHAEIARSPQVRQHVPMLGDMASRLANPQVRNQGTIGGNLCFGDPATDPPSCLMVLNADVVLSGARGQRVLKIDDFIVDYYATALEAGEILSEIRIPPSNFSCGYHARFLRTAAEHRPLINLAVSARKNGTTCEDIRMAVGAATVRPTRLAQAEAVLRGTEISPADVARAADAAAAEIEPISDIRGSADYRRDMVRVLARRTIQDLFGLGEPAQQRVA